MLRTHGNSARVLGVVALAVGCAMFSPAFGADTSSPSLKATTTADKTASVGVPSGWTFVNGSKGSVYVTGPHGEQINLGVIVIGKNAPTGSGLGGEVAFALPFTASLKDKFSAILEAGAAKAGKPEPDITFASEIPTKLPMCSRLFGGWTASDQSRKFEAIMCSLKPDYLGLYKNIVFLANVPSSNAAQDRPIVEKIAGSYRVTPDMFKKMLAAYTTLPPMPAAGGGAAALPGYAPYQDPTNSDCFDYNVIRESPPWEVPMHCGGHMPD
ncbi:MAG TPA: hypothetical protein VGD50_07080 [Candidatus Baltobacteraceae bacterium]